MGKLAVERFTDYAFGFAVTVARCHIKQRDAGIRSFAHCRNGFLT